MGVWSVEGIECGERDSVENGEMGYIKRRMLMVCVVVVVVVVCCCLLLFVV